METYKVPMRNLFYLISYAKDLPSMVQTLNDIDDSLLTYDFIVQEFLFEVEGLFRRGLVRDYVTSREETGTIRGRIMMNESMDKIVHKRPIVVCEADEYSTDILLQQIMTVTLRHIQLNPFISEQFRRRSSVLLQQISNISPISLNSAHFHQIHFHRHNDYYKRMVHIAYMLFECTLLSHNQGQWNLFSAQLSDEQLNELFEQFLYNFFKTKQTDYYVEREYLRWNLKGNPTYLPSMITDVSLTHRSKSKKIIVDAKFYKYTFQINRGRRSYHSDHMYQMFAYLQHQPIHIKDVQGILIYPYNGRSIDETYAWDDRLQLRFVTLDLRKKWPEIEQTLLTLI